MSIKNAVLASLGWIALSMVFAFGVYTFMGADKGSQWLTAYIVEKSLSVDNLLVFGLLFTYFGIPGKDQAKYLYYGILGSVIMRGAFIGVGLALINSFHWLYFLCGAFLVYTASKMLGAGEGEEPKFDQSWVYRALQGKVSMFWLIVAVLEVTDIAFATDSVPAALAISNDTFVVWSSNILAILGLRSLYFLLLACMDRLCYLKYGVSAVLCLIGLKMLAPLMDSMSKLDTSIWLCIVGGTLGTACLLSLVQRVPSPDAPAV